MHGLIAWWVRNTVAANLLMVFIIISGLIAWSTIEKEVQPIVTIPVCAGLVDLARARHPKKSSNKSSSALRRR